MGTPDVRYDLILDGVGYMVENYEEFPLAPLVAKVAQAGGDAKYDDLTGPQTHAWDAWDSGFGQRRGDSAGQFFLSSGIETRFKRDISLAERMASAGYPHGGGRHLLSMQEYNGIVYLGFTDRIYRWQRRVIVDTFNRADAATLGTSDSGHSWSTVTGSFGISGSQASGAASLSLASVLLSGSDQIVDLNMGIPAAYSGSGPFCGVAMRIGGASWVEWRMGGASNQSVGASLYRVDSGADTLLYAYSVGDTPIPADRRYRYRLQTSGSAARISWPSGMTTGSPGGGAWNDNRQIGSAVLSTYTGSAVGIRVPSDLGVSARFDNFQASDSLEWLTTAPTSPCYSMAVWNNALWCAVEGASLWKFNGTTWTQPAAQEVWYLCIWDDKLIGGYTDTTNNVTYLKYTTDGITWTAICSLNDPGAIRSLTVYPDRAGDLAIHLGMTTGVWVIDYTAGRSYLLLDFHQDSDVFNCYGMREWQGSLYVPWKGRLLRYNGSSVISIGPPTDELPRGTAGKIAGTAASAQYLYVSYTDISGQLSPSFILAYDGSAWHVVYTTELSTFVTGYYPLVGRVYVDGDDNLIAHQYNSVAGYYGGDVLFQKTHLPLRHYPNKWFYESDGSWITSWFTAGKYTVDKTFLDVTVQSEKLVSAATQRIEVWYQLDDNTDDSDLDGSWTYLGTATTSPYQTVAFTDITARSIRFRLRLRGDYTDPSLTPRLVSLALRYSVVPARRIGCRFVLLALDNSLLLNGQPDRRKGSAIWSSFQTTQQKKVPVSMTCPDGTVRTVDVIGFGKREWKRMARQTGQAKVQVTVNEVA